MHIAIVTGPFLAPPPGRAGAVERAWHGLAEQFARVGHRVTFLCREIPELAPNDIVNGVRYIRRMRPVRDRRTLVCLARDFTYSWRMARRIPSDADVVIGNTFWLPPLVPVRGDRPRITLNMQRMPKGQLRLYRRAHRIFVVSRAVQAAVVAELPSIGDRVRVIPNPIDTDAFCEGHAVRPVKAAPTILYAGRLHPEKGIHLLIDAARRLRDRGHAFALRIVGPVSLAEGGGGPEFEARLRALSADVPVTFDRPIYDRAQLADAYRSADVFCYPSLAERGETFGVAPLEAMACGTPTVVSNLDCFRDYLIPDVNGSVFPHASEDAVDALTKTLARLLAEPETRARIGKQGAETAAEYSYAKVADRYLAEFESWGLK